MHAFCDRLNRGCAGTHQWAHFSEEPNRVAYRYSRCMWAEVFPELGEPELRYTNLLPCYPFPSRFSPTLKGPSAGSCARCPNNTDFL